MYFSLFLQNKNFEVRNLTVIRTVFIVNILIRFLFTKRNVKIFCYKNEARLNLAS